MTRSLFPILAAAAFLTAAPASAADETVVFTHDIADVSSDADARAALKSLRQAAFNACRLHGIPVSDLATRREQVACAVDLMEAVVDRAGSYRLQAAFDAKAEQRRLAGGAVRIVAID